MKPFIKYDVQCHKINKCRFLFAFLNEIYGGFHTSIAEIVKSQISMVST